MKKIQIVVIDDSNILHALLNRIIAQIDDINIIGSALTGNEGVELVKKLNPDVVIMDINMPGMNGLEAISIIMEEQPTPIIVFTSASKEIVDISFKALDLGAVEIIEKPFADDFSALQKIAEEKLIKSIRTFVDFKVIRRIKHSFNSILKDRTEKLISVKSNLHEYIQKAEPIEKKEDPASVPDQDKNFPIVCIASSTGGPQILNYFFSKITCRYKNASFVVVQHMANGFLQGFCEWLNIDSKMPVEITIDKGNILPNKIYIAPENYHLKFDSDGRFKHLDEPPIVGIRPSADILLRSAAEVFKSRVIAIILTGMGSDGSKAISEVKKNGGYIIAQDEESSIIFGMPKSAIDTGYVDKVLSIESMPEFLEKLCRERIFK